MSIVKPFLKWAGNKTRLLKHILPRLPQAKRLIEPFAGSGAVFLNAGFQDNILGEANQDLIHLYQYLKKDGQNFIDDCKILFTPEYNTREAYDQIKDRFNHSDKARERASLFLYLNRHGYNGLCRYNLKGVFNVPFGSYVKPYFPATEMLNFHAHCQKAQFIFQDFRKSFAIAQAGDVIYCDPPYIPISKTASFAKYTNYLFAESDQRVLAELAIEAAHRGATVLISNHDLPLARTLYDQAEICNFPVQRFISCNGDNRNPVMELLAVFKPYLG